MADYIFNINDISQHMLKYGLDSRPVLTAKLHRPQLQDYCNWLIENFPQRFGTVLSTPEKIEVHNVYSLGNNRIDVPAFLITPRGPLFSLPHQFFGQPDIAPLTNDSRQVIEKSIAKFKETFPQIDILRLGCMQEMVFDCGNINPVNIISGQIRKERWRKNLTNVKIHLENPTENFNVNLDLAPAYAQQVTQTQAGQKEKTVRFGISVRLDINNRKIDGDLSIEQINEILDFSDSYLADQLIDFLNNE